MRILTGQVDRETLFFQGHGPNNWPMYADMYDGYVYRLVTCLTDVCSVPMVHCKRAGPSANGLNIPVKWVSLDLAQDLATCTAGTLCVCTYGPKCPVMQGKHLKDQCTPSRLHPGMQHILHSIWLTEVGAISGACLLLSQVQLLPSEVVDALREAPLHDVVIQLQTANVQSESFQAPNTATQFA